MEDLIKELKEGIGCVDKLQLTIAKLEEKIKGSAEKWVAEHKNKEVELIKGEIYFCHDFTCSRIVRMDTIIDEVKYNSISNISGGGLFRVDEVLNNNNFRKTIRPATEEEKQKLIKAEKEHGRFWSQEKGDYLGLDDVRYKANTRQDLKDIINICPLSLLGTKFNTCTFCKCVQLFFGVLVNKDHFDAKKNQVIPVSKQTFITLLKNHK